MLRSFRTSVASAAVSSLLLAGCAGQRVVTSNAGSSLAVSEVEGTYAGISDTSKFLTVDGRLFQLAPDGSSIRVVALKGGDTTEIENVSFADGEVMDFIAAGVEQDIWLAANICKGEVDRSDMMVCIGSQSAEIVRVSLQGGAVRVQSYPGRYVDQLERYRDGVFLTTNDAVSPAANSVTAVLLQPDGSSLDVPTVSGSTVCGTERALTALSSDVDNEKMRNTNLRLSRYDNGTWKAVDLPVDQGLEPFDAVLGCDGDEVVVVFKTSGGGKAVKVSGDGTVEQLPLPGEGPVDASRQLSSERSLLVTRLTKDGGLLIVAPTQPDTRVEVSTSDFRERRIVFVDLDPERHLIGLSAGDSLEVKRG